MYCAMCGVKVDLASKFCSNCGFSLGTDASQANSQTLQTQFVPVSTTTERRRTLFGRFFWGELGLARTFWIGGIGVTGGVVALLIFLSFLIDFFPFTEEVISIFLFLMMVPLAVLYVPLVMTSIWRASYNYQGNQSFALLARAFVFSALGIIVWLLANISSMVI